MREHSEKLGVVGLLFALLLVIGVALAYTFLNGPEKAMAPNEDSSTEMVLDETDGKMGEMSDGVNAGNATTFVSWEEAIEILHSGQVREVLQSHDLTVMMALEDGTVAKTKEPSIDAIFVELDNCGDGCGVKTIATE